MERSSSNRWLILVIGIISIFFAGIIYAWSILKVPFEQEFGWSPSQLSLNFTLTMCSFCLGSLASGLLLKKNDPSHHYDFRRFAGRAGFHFLFPQQRQPFIPLYQLWNYEWIRYWYGL